MLEIPSIRLKNVMKLFEIWGWPGNNYHGGKLDCGSWNAKRPESLEARKLESDIAEGRKLPGGTLPSAGPQSGVPLGK